MSISIERTSRPATSIQSDPRWAAVVARDANADGTFFYSVKTTGVYCRPSCPARLPRRENVAFHDTATDAEAAGFRPCKRCKPGASAEIHFAIGGCSLGSVLVAKSEKGVCAILMGDDPKALARDLQARFPKASLLADHAQLRPLLTKVGRFIEAPAGGLDFPLDARGTPFQRRVWRALGKIPAGSTASYTDIARRIGAPNSVRAVAQACGANAIAVAIPCHRVVRNDGALSGYRWGVGRKRALLEREAAPS
jgi:AraC family transcriptional regulator, regulatory protein of adaptative response / methylated-DNA-[protein]-cysteine methyltransferase